jgi:hypothetical protein
MYTPSLKSIINRGRSTWKRKDVEGAFNLCNFLLDGTLEYGGYGWTIRQCTPLVAGARRICIEFDDAYDLYRDPTTMFASLYLELLISRPFSVQPSILMVDGGVIEVDEIEQHPAFLEVLNFLHQEKDWLLDGEKDAQLSRDKQVKNWIVRHDRQMLERENRLDWSLEEVENRLQFFTDTARNPRQARKRCRRYIRTSIDETLALTT